jgi:ABC-2 type transport system permease protein
MKNIYFIWKREVTTYFTSPVAYFVVVLFLVIMGALFWLDYFREINNLSLRGFFEQAPLFLAFFAPAVTMGSFADEKRSGTLELTMTMPVSDASIVVGKFLAAVTLLSVVFAMTLPYPYTLSTLGNLDWGAVAAGYAGLLLLGSSYAAIGIMTSSWTREQVVAILSAFSICFALYVVGVFFGRTDGDVASAVQYISTGYHFGNLARGVIDLRDVIYYLSLIGVSLTIAHASISSRRW